VTDGRLVTQATALLGDGGPIVVEPPAWAARVAATRAVAAPTDAATGALVSFLGARLDAAARTARLDALAARLPSGAPLVVVDHNQPRTWAGRLVGTLVLAVRGFAPARARHPVAREVDAHGFAVERLSLARGERVQLVRACRR
jgi:hypothetical protein